MKSKTYDEWLLAGYQVQRGQKATGRNADGKATFTEKQVDHAGSPRFRRDNPEPGDYAYEEDVFYNGIDGYFDNIGDR